ncbi:hypothetical protein B0G62_102178 [Paraburkholderia eburnea]|uniref:Uncharacterized protein n=1 Tax=Paraburkholderia eburnea TaxID=1189126 RepID=A0A2S4MIK8_9BURK|nr:hypothetical protein [Paraburkholderia eburnea]POR54570.1 hypothetical protein B0G62_102178 [Paraburkholderia eburnea]PRZ19785.1 hypothetical protein BX588_114178 [Paraburkholderia eburnea]
MPIKKDYETPSTGAVASYHVTGLVTLDATAKTTMAMVYSYLSADARAAGKAPMYTQQIPVTGLPPDGQDAFAYADQQLIVAPASDDSAALNPARSVFVGGDVVT